MSPGRLVLGVLLAAAMAVAIGSIGVAGGERQTIEIDIRWSHFRPSQLRVPAGVPIRVVLVNHDPIDHEWIVGDEAMHAAHRTGTEPSHGSRPTEQSIPAGARVETIVTFNGPGALAFICHLPGHEAYGMSGRLVVVD
jgi:uncharacterized cupredoxin-like copper-binding protein